MIYAAAHGNARFLNPGVMDTMLGFSLTASQWEFPEFDFRIHVLCRVVYCCLLFLFFGGVGGHTHGIWSSQAREQNRAKAVTYTGGVALVDP